MTKHNMDVLVNAIGAVESGGQIYGRRRYSAYAAPYTNSQKEHTITLGWAQNYGDEAQKLISMIYTKDPEAFKQIDRSGSIRNMIDGRHDWVKERWNPSSAQKQTLISLIDSSAGHECQDRLFADLMEKYIADCEKTYTKSTKAVMMYCEIRHLGGLKPVNRIFDRLGGNFSLDAIMASLVKDQRDPSSNNQVGDAKFWSRHLKCREFIDRYCEDEQVKEVKAELTAITDFSAYKGKISNSGHDERGRYSGGKAGDQTGTEWSVINWYSRPWTHVIRFSDRQIAEMLATLSIYAAQNDLVGYDQYKRTSYWQHLEASGYDPRQITVPCNNDCSAGVLANVKASLILTGHKDWADRINVDGYTGNMRKIITSCGADVKIHTMSEYVSSPDKLLPGDILLYEGHHTAVNLGEGKATMRRPVKAAFDYRPVFDDAFYKSRYSDIKKAYGSKDAYEHFRTYGIKEGRQGCSTFDPAFYKAHNPDVAAAYGEDWTKYYQHYITFVLKGTEKRLGADTVSALDQLQKIAPAQKMAEVLTDLNVRKHPVKTAERCSFSPLKQGERVTVVKPCVGGWYLIENSVGKRGYVSGKYIGFKS